MKRLVRTIGAALALILALTCLAEGAPDAGAGVERFFDTWACDGASVEIFQEDGVLTCTVLLSDGDKAEDRWTYRNCVYDADIGQVVCDGEGTKRHFSFENEDAEANSEVTATGLSARFAIDDKDRLSWIDTVEGMGKGLTFLRQDKAEAEDAVVTSISRPVRLGASIYQIDMPDTFVGNILDEAAVEQGQVASYYNEDSDMEFSVWQFPREGRPDTLPAFAMEEAGQYAQVMEVRGDGSINGIPAAWYRTNERVDSMDYETLTYIFASGDDYVELVFWLAGDEDRMQAWAILDSLTAVELVDMPLGDTGYVITLPADYSAGELTEENVADGQVAWYRGVSSALEINVYSLPKTADSLSGFAAEQIGKYEMVGEYATDARVNGIPVAWYRTVEGELRTISCLFDGGDNYIELVFWMDADTSEAEVNAVLLSLRQQSLQAVQLADSDYALTLPVGFVRGAVTEAGKDEGQTACYYSELSALDIDVYREPKGYAATPEEYVVAYAAAHDSVTGQDGDVSIGDIPAARYTAVEQYDEGEYDTVGYVLDNGDSFIRVVFWLEGPNAAQEADDIIQSLTRNG